MRPAGKAVALELQGFTFRRAFIHAAIGAAILNDEFRGVIVAIVAEWLLTHCARCDAKGKFEGLRPLAARHQFDIDARAALP